MWLGFYSNYVLLFCVFYCFINAFYWQQPHNLSAIKNTPTFITWGVHLFWLKAQVMNMSVRMYAECFCGLSEAWQRKQLFSFFVFILQLYEGIIGSFQLKWGLIWGSPSGNTWLDSLNINKKRWKQAAGGLKKRWKRPTIREKTIYCLQKKWKKGKEQNEKQPNLLLFKNKTKSTVAKYRKLKLVTPQPFHSWYTLNNLCVMSGSAQSSCGFHICVDHKLEQRDAALKGTFYLKLLWLIIVTIILGQRHLLTLVLS